MIKLHQRESLKLKQEGKRNKRNIIDYLLFSNAFLKNFNLISFRCFFLNSNLLFDLLIFKKIKNNKKEF